MEGSDAVPKKDNSKTRPKNGTASDTKERSKSKIRPRKKAELESYVTATPTAKDKMESGTMQHSMPSKPLPNLNLTSQPAATIVAERGKKRVPDKLQRGKVAGFTSIPVITYPHSGSDSFQTNSIPHRQPSSF